MAQRGASALANGEPITVKVPTPMKPPTPCALRRDPEATLAKPLKQQLNLLCTVVEQSRWWRCPMRCRDRRQRSLSGFHEEVDRAGGEDPRDATFAPVETRAEIVAVCAAPQGRLGGFVPRLRKDWPGGQARPTLRRVTGPAA